MANSLIMCLISHLSKLEVLMLFGSSEAQMTIFLSNATCNICILIQSVILCLAMLCVECVMSVFTDPHFSRVISITYN